MRINYSDEDIVKGQRSILLVGTTPRGKDSISWRQEACEILENIGFDGVVYVLEYSSWKPKESCVDQAMWERIALSESTIIAFWIPTHLPDMPAFTTNVEFGYWLHTGKVVYGRPDDAEKIKYLDWLYELDYSDKSINNLQQLLEKAAVKAKILTFNKKLFNIVHIRQICC